MQIEELVNKNPRTMGTWENALYIFSRDGKIIELLDDEILELENDLRKRRNRIRESFTESRKDLQTVNVETLCPAVTLAKDTTGQIDIANNIICLIGKSYKSYKKLHAGYSNKGAIYIIIIIVYNNYYICCNQVTKNREKKIK